MNAGEVMTRNPVAVRPLTAVAEVWDLMRELEIRHVPVVENGALVGMVSDRDLARFDIGLMTLEGAEAIRQRLGTPVVKLMSSDVICVEPESDLSEVVELLVEHKIGAVPVVRSDTRELIGILSYVDVLRAVRDFLEEA